MSSNNEIADKFQNRKVVMISEEYAYSIEFANQEHTTVEERTSLYSNQEGTESRVVLYYKYAHKQRYESARVRRLDSDVFFHTVASCQSAFL